MTKIRSMPGVRTVLPFPRAVLVFPVLFFLLIMAGCSQSSRLVLTNVHVVDPATARLERNRAVVIQEGRIAAVLPAAEAPDGARRVDGRGGYLMPGLLDMHAHLRHPMAAELIFPQFIAHGVTGVREMNSECDGPEEGNVCLEQMQAWQAAIDTGEQVGPRLLALSSFQVNPPWDYEVTEEQIRGLVAEMDRRGVDLIKTYHQLSPQAFRWLADEAGARDLDVAGHLPLQMTVEEASAAGLRSLEHARDLLFDCFPGSSAFRESARSQDPPMDVLRRMTASHDEAACARVYRTMAENGTWYVPTHVTRRMEALAGDPSFREDPRLRYIWPEVEASWQADADRMAERGGGEQDRAALMAFYETGLAITGRAHRAGVRVLMGTDSGDSYSFFGSGAHDELHELVKAGLTPAEALAAATSEAAAFLRREQDLGSVEPGKLADLVLLRNNPLEDIDHVRDIEAVILGGRYFDRAALDGMLLSVSRRVGTM